MGDKSLWQRVQDDEFKSKLPFSVDKVVRAAHSADCRRLEGEFRKAALEEVGLTGHPKADKAYALAWLRGHSAGFCEVLSELDELAELLKD